MMAEKKRNGKPIMTRRKRIFIEEYLKSWNGSDAAVKAGYSERSRHEMAHRLLNDPVVMDAIRTRVETACMSANEVLIRLAEQARNEGSEYIRKDGTVDLAALIADGKSHLIKGIKYSRQGKPIVEFYDSQAALQLIGRALSMFKDNVDLTSGGEKIVVNLISDGD